MSAFVLNMSKGSLNDVLLNEDIPLNWGFRFSFCGDISRAMVYLHQHKLYHGRLKSNNCIIDDRWVVKVSDYGLRNIRKEEFGDDEYEETYQKQMARVYLPPEALDDPKNIYLPTTDLIKACWNEDPNERPTFSNIKQSLHRINPNKASPVDMMMQLMEKYSKHLEVLVAERTQDLVLEKQKTDRLLYSMLPKAVADQLRQGMSAAAENFDECTIFFSDIVGFTSISGSSTPYEVVALLNKLYVAFDSIIDSYDVYKVETIGDAYMVVSGVPKRNGYIHASEIASMALDLVKVCETFVIPHKPDEKLQIRAGIHSGSVVAGVVGLKMPRYCLFGDTVNTASRMESTGEALKIQASDPCVTCLKQIGSFKVECRGDMQIKGKGIMRTWWVKDKDPNIKPESKIEGYLDINQIVRDDKDNNVKKLSLEERSDDLSCQNISLPGSIEEKETNEGPEMGGFKQYDKPANLFLPPLDNGGLNIPLDSDVTEHTRVPSPTDNTVPVNISHVVTSSNLNRASLPPVETITMNGAVPPSVETIADIASPMENTEKAKKKHKKKKKHKEKKRKEEKETVQNYLGSGTLKDNGDVKNGQVSVVFNESTQKFGSAEPLIGNDLESKV
uniref:Guanylate cyclase n=1 Tax=Saccoglossus kowalevskii TaxID=10224 RepID=A0ABM0MNQ9_SACKO|nr:PREDICTED: atrial natriuretic peptide receptor 1-like [Saccoglossus kowalevskii]